jgi:hypothetical protein
VDLWPLCGFALALGAVRHKYIVERYKLSRE